MIRNGSPRTRSRRISTEKTYQMPMIYRYDEYILVYMYTCAIMPPCRELVAPPPFFSSLAPRTWLSRSVTLGELPDCPVPDLSTVENKTLVNCRNNDGIPGRGGVSFHETSTSPASRERPWRRTAEEEEEEEEERRQSWWEEENKVGAAEDRRREGQGR